MPNSRASKYAQVSTSIRAVKSKMLGKEGYDRLLRCSTSSECTSILREEGYFEDSTRIGESLDETSQQDLIDAKVTGVLHRLARLCPADCGQVLAELENRQHLEFLKLGLRLISAPGESEALGRILVSGVKGDVLRNIVETRNVELLVQSAGVPRLYGEISSALAENRPLPLIEAMVDRYSLQRIWAATDMPDSIDKQSARPLVGEHIDMVNLLLVARSKALGVPSEEIQRVLVPVEYRLGGALSESVNSTSTTNALRAFTKTVYVESIAPFLEAFKDGDSLHPLDMSLRRRHALRCLSTFAGFPFCAGLPLAFAYLMTYEASDIRSIISGKRDMLTADRIRESLVL